MSPSNTNNAHSESISGAAGLGRVGAACKQILNLLVEAATRSAERSRFAALPRRYLDDVGMTIAERDAMVR